MTPRERMLELLRRFGWNATSFQALEPSFRYWFDDDGEAAVSYFDTGAAWVTAGPPVSNPARLAEVARRFTAAARSAHRRVAFFAVEDRFLDAIAMQALEVGLQPSWNPREWAARHRGHRSMREQLRRARAKRLRVERLESEQIAALRPEMDRIIARWESTRNMPPMAFLVELSPYSFAEERRYYTARVDDALVAFLVAVPVYQRNGWFFEDILRDARAPNGTAESLIDFAMRDVAEDGATFATLGLAPLAGDTSWQRFARRAAAGFYNFEGLRSFKAKLRPDEWSSISIAWPSRVTPLVALFDSLDAFAGGKLIRFGMRTVFRAPSVVLNLLAALVLPWAMALVRADTKQWFPSRAIQIGWFVFDLAMSAALFSLARRWNQKLALAACCAASADAALTLAQAATYNAPRIRNWRDAIVVAIAVAAPFAVAGILFGGLRRRH
jgi:lysylphosphatidylglycerol synthetase-like protein (DUF2156 family)